MQVINGLSLSLNHLALWQNNRKIIINPLIQIIFSMASGFNNGTHSSCHGLLLESEVYFIYREPDFSCASTHFSWIIQRWAKLGSSASHLPVQHTHMWRHQRRVWWTQETLNPRQDRCAQVWSRPMHRESSVHIWSSYNTTETNTNWPFVTLPIVGHVVTLNLNGVSCHNGIHY